MWMCGISSTSYTEPKAANQTAHNMPAADAAPRWI